MNNLEDKLDDDTTFETPNFSRDLKDSLKSIEIANQTKKLCHLNPLLKLWYLNCLLETKRYTSDNFERILNGTEIPTVIQLRGGQSKLSLLSIKASNLTKLCKLFELCKLSENRLFDGPNIPIANEFQNNQSLDESLLKFIVKKTQLNTI